MSSNESSKKSGASREIEIVGRISTVPAILKAVAELTRMRFVVIAKVTKNQWLACAVLDEMEFGLPVGGELEVTTTLCSEVRDQMTPIVIGHASQDPEYCSHPTPKKYGIESYIAVPIVQKNGEFFGTLCAIDSRPTDLSNETIVGSLNLFAELIANELGSEDSFSALVESESKRRESENRIRAVTDAMPGLISYIDRDYRYQFVNRAYTDWHGVKAEDLINKPIVDVVGKERLENVRPHFDAAFRGETEIFETEVEHPRGGKRFIRATFTPDILDGQVRGIFVLALDITEEKLAHDAVNRSDERYKAFIKQSTEGIWRFELERPIPTNLSTEDQILLAYTYGYLAECNDAMAKQYGFSSASEIVGARLSELLVQDDPKNVEFLRSFIESDYHLSEAESHEKDAEGKDRYFLNNFVGILEGGFLLRAWGTQRDITETKLAGDATARLAAIVVSSEDGIISKDLMGNITSWNVGATKMFGYKAEEVIGKPITLLVPPDRLDESADILRRIRREENVEHFETIRRRSDGTDIFVALTVSPIRSAEGNVVGASKIVRDITDRKRIEETIHHNQAMLTLAMQSSRMGVWELDLATNTVSWSEELEEIYGLEKGTFGGTEEHFFELLHEDDREAVWNEIRAAVAEHRDYSIEFRFQPVDGSTRWMEGRGEAVYSQKGDPVRLYGVGIDITERKNAEKALRESEQRFSRFMQHLPGLAWIKDIEGRYVYANESAEKSFGVSGPELYGKTDDEIFPEETAKQFQDHDQRALLSGSGIQITESLLEEDGILHHSIVSKFPITAADGKLTLIGGMAIDVTDQKQAEEALRRRVEFDEAVMRNMGEGLYTVDAAGLVTSMNPAAEKLFGWTFEELRGRKMHDLTHYKRRDGSPFPAEECAGLQVVRDGTSLIDHEDVFIRRDGTFFDVLFSSSPLREHDKIVGLVVVFTDITERKLAEQTLILQEEISDLIRTVSTADELLYSVAAAVGVRLQAKRALFNEIDLENDVETVHRDYCAEDVPSVAGAHPISDYSPITSGEMEAGKTVVNRDSKTDERTAEHYERSYEPNGERAYVAVPLLRNNTWVASLWVSDDEPRNWHKEHVSLLETIAERTWAAVEKMRINAALRESQERFSKAFNSGPLVFTLSSLKDGRLVEVNDTFVEVTGYSREEALGKTGIELGLWASEKDRDEELAAVRTVGHVRDLEYSFRTRSGEEIIGLLSAEKIDIGGEAFALSVIQDITARKLTEEALSAATAKFSSVFNQSGIFAGVMDHEGYLLEINDLALEACGYSRDEVVDRPFWETPWWRMSEETKERIRFATKQAATGEVFRETLPYWWADGTNRLVDFAMHPIRDQHGKVVFLHPTGIDITDRKHAEEALIKSENLFRAFVTTSSDAVYRMSADWSLMRQLTGREFIPDMEQESSDWMDRYIHPDDRDKVADAIQKAIGTKSMFELEHRVLRVDGSTGWTYSRAIPILDNDGEIVEWFGAAADVTARLQAEDALRQSETKYRTLFDSMDEGFCIIEVIFDSDDRPVDYRFIEVNSAFERQSGLRDVTGKRMLEFVSDIEPHWLETYGRVAKTGEPIRFANEYKSLYRWFDVYAFRPVDAEKNHVAVLFNDITSRVRVEGKIRESEARFRTMADNAPVMIWVTDPTGYCMFLSQSWYEYTGQTPESGLGFGWLDVLHPDDRVRAEADFRSANEKCERFTTEYRFANSAGEYHWAIDSAQPRFDASGNYLGYIGSVVDIHERKLAEDAIVRAERKAAEEYQTLLARIVPLAATLGRSRDLTTIYRAVRDFISASMKCSGFFVSFFETETNLRHAAYVWGEGAEVDIAALPPMTLQPEGGGANSRAVFEKRTIIMNNYWDDMKNRPHLILSENGIDPMSSLIVPMMIKDTVLGTLEVQAHENDAFYQEHAVALEMAANLAAVAIENVRLIETEAAAREAAESANRAKDEFLSVLSHELRTPLNAMLGWVRMLKAGVLDEENSERALEVIERNTRLQSSLIEDLLDVSRIISGKMRIETELVDLVSVVQTVSETTKPLADAKAITYRFIGGPESVFLNADPVRLQQVVSNLLQNSIKFTPAGGKIEISLERDDDMNAILSVRDTGVGIAKELLPYIFDRFRQADASARRNFTGLGLGLTIVRNIVELHGGTVEVDSDGKDRGAVFTLTLPLAADFYSTVTHDEEHGNSHGGSLAGQTILLVDDDRENLLPLKLFLENENAAVTPAASAIEALSILARQDFNLMITDIGMPEIDGYELVTRLRANSVSRNSTLKAIALTAYASVDDRERALQAGFQAHLAKPVNFDELLSTIKKVARNGH